MTGLKGLFSRLLGTAPSMPAAAEPPQAAAGPGDVVPFPSASSRTDLEPAFGGASPRRPGGLLDHRLLREFFAEPHFGLGNHNGAHYRSVEALQRGRDALVQRFVNVLDTIVEQKTTELYRLQDQAVLTKGVSGTIGERLELSQRRIEHDIERLHEQRTLASEGRGWVLKAINEYRTGYNKGLAEALAFEGLLQPENP